MKRDGQPKSNPEDRGTIDLRKAGDAAKREARRQAGMSEPKRMGKRTPK